MLREVRHGQTHWLSDPKGYWYLRFRDVIGRSDLERHIEVIQCWPMRGEPALLKTRAIDHHVDEVREFWKRLQNRVGEPRQPNGEGRVNPLPLVQ